MDNASRDRDIIKLRKQGLLYREIADIHGLSKNRVWQVVKKHELKALGGSRIMQAVDN